MKAGEQVVPALQKVLASQPTIETRKRVEELLDKLTGGTLTTEQLRLVRAVEALERMGTAGGPGACCGRWPAAPPGRCRRARPGRPWTAWAGGDR